MTDPEQPTQTFPNSTLVQVAPPRTEPRPLPVPGYELLDLLGRGGMGVVYKARQINLDRLVALKMLLAGDSADALELARFQTEAEAVARLQHPNIVQIFDVGQHDGRPYFSLEFVAGGTLAQKLAGTPLAPRAAAELLAELANTIQYAHERNILHRDLKPSNVLLTEHGQPKIADFGLAKRLDSDDGRTRTGAILGTPSYMAPEQAWGSATVGPRADIYALGAILYECLVGRPPFRGATLLDTLDQVRTADVVSVRSLNPKVPRDLETITLKCLAKEPTQRYLTARDLALDLRRFLDGEPVTARPLSRLGRLWRSARKRPALALGIALTLVTLVLGIGGGLAWYLYQASDAARQRFEQLHTDAEQARAEAVAARQQLEHVLHYQRVQAALREWERSDIGRARALLDDTPPALRGWEWHYVRRLITPYRTLGGHLGAVDSTAFTPDGRRVISAGFMDGIRAWNLADGSEAFLFEGTERRAGPGGGRGATGYFPITFTLRAGELLGNQHGGGLLEAWSLETGKRLRGIDLSQNLPRNRAAFASDGRWLAFSPYGANFAFAKPPIPVADPRTGKELATLEGHRNLAHLLAASPAGTLLASADTQGAGFLWDMKTYKKLCDLPNVSPHLTGLAFAPDGATLFACGSDGVLSTWTAPNWQPNWTAGHQPLKFTTLAVRPDGIELACGTEGGAVVQFETLQGHLVATQRGHLRPRSQVTSLAYSADGKLLASGGRDGTLRVWDATQRPDAERRQIPVVAGSALAFDHLGRHLVTGSENGTVRLWHLPARTPGKQLACAHRIGSLEVAAQAPRVAIVTQSAQGAGLRVWDWATDRILLDLPGIADVIEHVALTGDGARVYLAGAAPAGSFLRCFDLATAQECPLGWRSEGFVQALTASPDGKLLATRTAAGVITVRALADGSEILVKRIGKGGWPLRFSPDSTLLAATVLEGVRVWSVDTGRELLRGSVPGEALHLAFTPDGGRLVTVGALATVWDVRTGLEAVTLPEPERVLGLAFSPDGHTLWGANASGDVIAWHGGP